MNKLRIWCMLTGLLLLLSACSKEQGTEPDVPPPPPVTSKQPFRITSPTDTALVSARQTITLRWVLLDTALSALTVHYRYTSEIQWRQLVFTSAQTGEISFDVKRFKYPTFKLAISTTDEKHWDSSGVITLDDRPVRLITPTDGAIFVGQPEVTFTWEAREPGIEMVQIQWSIHGGPWQFGYLRLTSDSSFHPVDAPFTTGQCVDFRIRAFDWSGWSYTRSVAFAEFELRSPAEGGVLYRWLPLEISATVNIPCDKNRGEVQYELSLDEGRTWLQVEQGRRITEDARSGVMLRMTHTGTGWVRTHSAIRIEDRSSEYFSLSPGKTFRYYVFGTDATPSFTDTTSRSWHTITVLRERSGIGRTEYECSIVIETPDGSRSTSTGLLWRQHDGQQMIGGSFEPFKNVNLPGIHDISVDILNTSIVHGTPGEIPISSTSYETRRGKGIVSKTFATAVSRIPPRGYGTHYRLLE
ncbi:MAG: hypothetical protein M5R41_03375 [Bacteroidia bacterium]|nr:hypothetical protein [Bacteroidia bacterium]